MKSKEQEQAEWDAFQEKWKDASREAILQRLYRAQHQAILYAHQVDAFKKRTTWLEDQLAYARRLIDLIVEAGNFRTSCPDFSASGVGRAGRQG